MTTNNVSWMNTSAEFAQKILQTKLFLWAYSNIDNVNKKNARNKRKKMKEKFLKENSNIVIF